MARIFDEHYARRVQCLDGAWKFLTDPQGVGSENGFQSSLPEGETVIVPSVWNTECGLLKYEGIAWYEKNFFCEGGCVLFRFGAVMTECEVFLDGERLGYHYGGFCEFEFIAKDVSRGMHTLTVKVDNRFDEHSIPQKMVDWYHYGGITRSVTAEILEGIAILSHRFDYKLSADLKSAICTPKVTLYNAKKRRAETTLTLSLDGEIMSQCGIGLSGGKTMEISLPSFTLDGVRIWDEGKPELYSLELRTDTDDLFDRIGFRKIEVKNEKLLLNGREIEIRGINRHHDHPDFGMAFPPARMKHDIDLIEELGCNSIRGSHYPNSRDFVDMLDERGILFWSEIPIWGGGFADETLGDKIVVERGLDMHREMIKHYYNHPSIIIWGLHNEIHVESKQAYEMTKKYYSLVKAIGGDRAVVYATCRPMVDICLEFSDIICINAYYGWYAGGLDAWEPFLEQFCARRDELGLSDKPIIFSEFGGGAVYGIHDAELSIWSEEYQAKLLGFCIDLFHAHPSVVGTYVWQFCDMRTAAEMGMTRARGFNNKGIMNEYRRPKAGFYAVKDCYTRFKAEENK